MDSTKIAFDYLIENKTNLMRKFIYNYIDDKKNAEDFYQDLFIQIHEGSKKGLINAIKNNKIDGYIYMVISNNLRSNTSKYAKKYNTSVYNVEIKDDILKDDSNDWIDSERTNIELKETLKGLYNEIYILFEREKLKNPKFFWKADVFELHLKDGLSMREISRCLGIPLTSIHLAIKTCKKLIKDNLKNPLNIVEKSLKEYNEFN